VKKEYYHFIMSSLRYKIGFSYLLLVCVSLASSGVALYNFIELQSSVGQMMRENYQSVLAAERMSRALEVQQQAQEALMYFSVPLPGTRPVGDELTNAIGVFNKNRDVREMFDANREANLARADANWPKLVEAKGK